MSKKPIPEFVEDASAPLHGARWRFDAFELDERRRELSRAGELILIEPKPLNLLMLLLRHPGQLVTKNDLIETLWAGRIVTEAVLGNCVTKLRAALGEPLAGQLKTVHGYGYRFDVQAELIPDREAEAAPPKLQFEAGATIAQRPNWQLVRRLGLSGDSWLAEHLKTRARRVFKFTNDPQGLSALKREVTIYRLLRESLGDSARYVDILDWNFDAPPWFTESEYCAGGSLQEWFEAQGGVAKVPLPLRLELIAQIADAIAEIHAHGVLHKDLKPANVFVVPGSDGTPSIRLADFGSGRLMDVDKLAALQITRMGFTQVIETNPANTGTPLYLAPEVLDGFPPTLKADIYALGVMLYQCVVGNLRRPLATGWEQGIDDEMLRDDIAAAAEGNPERRLANAADLARKLRSIEQRRTVRIAEREAQARLERETRALERMRARRVGLIAAFAVLVCGTISTGIFAWRAERASEQALAEASRAKAVGEFLAGGMFSAINEDEKKVRDLTAKELVDRAANALPSFFPNQPDIEAELHVSLGKAYWALEYAPEAAREYSRAQEQYNSIYGVGSEKSVKLAADRIVTSFALGRIALDQSEYDRIEQEAIKVQDPSSPLILAFRVELVRSKLFLGQYTEVERSTAKLLQEIPDSNVKLLISVLQIQGVNRLHLFDLIGAEASLRRAIAILVKLSGDGSKKEVALRSILGHVLIESGRLDEAGAEFVLAKKIGSGWYRPQSGWGLVIRSGEARLKLERGNTPEAISDFETIIKDTIEDAGSGSDTSVDARVALATAYEVSGKFESAEAQLREALLIQYKIQPPKSSKLMDIEVSLVLVLAHLRKSQEARALTSGMSDRLERSFPSGHPIFAKFLFAKTLLAADEKDCVEFDRRRKDAGAALAALHAIGGRSVLEMMKRLRLSRCIDEKSQMVSVSQ